MTTEKAISQLESLIQDRESKIHRDDFDDMFLQDIEACKAGIKALEKRREKRSEIQRRDLYICRYCFCMEKKSIHTLHRLIR